MKYMRQIGNNRICKEIDFIYQEDKGLWLYNENHKVNMSVFMQLTNCMTTGGFAANKVCCKRTGSVEYAHITS